MARGRSGWGVIAAAALAAVLPAIGGCTSVRDILSLSDRPTASLGDVRLGGLSGDGASLEFDVDVANPYPVAMPLAGLSYDLSSNGATFLSGESPLSGTVPAGGTRRVTLPASVRFREMLSALSGVRPGDVVPYEAGLSLSAETPVVAGLSDGSPVTLPLRHRGNLPVPAAPEVSVTGIDWETLTLSEAAATVRMNVRNPNSFAAAVSRLAGTLSLGGRPVAQTGLPAPLSLEPGESGSVAIPISFRPSELGTAALNVLRRSSAGYELSGIADLATPFGDVSLPFERSGEAPLTR